MAQACILYHFDLASSWEKSANKQLTEVNAKQRSNSIQVPDKVFYIS